MQDDDQQQAGDPAYDRAPAAFEPRPYSTGDFHAVIHKQIVNAVSDTLAYSKLDWRTIEPFLQTAREMCRGDFEAAGTVQVHGLAPEGEALVEAEEAYVEVSIADQDSSEPWLTQTYWLSDLIVAGDDPEHVRGAIKGLERSIGKLNQWLENRDGKQQAEPNGA